MEKFEQKLKFGKHIIRHVECEKPSDDILTHRWSKSKSLGEDVIVGGRKGILKFKAWLNNLDI